MTTSETRFISGIDQNAQRQESVVLRFRNLLRFFESEAEDARFRAHLEQSSIREGVKLSRLASFGGVDVHLLDETTWMHTGSHKAIDGCFTAAMCLLRGYHGVVFESGGNTGRALGAYLSRAGIETHLFLPSENLDQIDGAFFESPHAHVIAVDRPDRVKRAAHLYGAMRRLPKVPETTWRYQAAEFRGCAVLEAILEGGAFDWIVQTISAGFGPLGIYDVLRRFPLEGGRLPRFLGVQQADNAPVFRAWRGNGNGEPAVRVRSTSGLLNKIMYDSAPHSYGSIGALRELLTKTQGDVVAVTRGEIRALLAERFDSQASPPESPQKSTAELLQGIGFRTHLDSGDPAALMTLAGAWQAIRSGIIQPGSRILCLLTGGARSAHEPAPLERVRRITVKTRAEVREGSGSSCGAT